VRNRSRAADRHSFAAQIFSFFYLRPRYKTIVETLDQVADADDFSPASGGIEQISRPDDRHIDFASNEGSDGDRRPRHQYKLDIEAVFIEEAAVFGDPES